jgi:hypothetical protein
MAKFTAFFAKNNSFLQKAASHSALAFQDDMTDLQSHHERGLGHRIDALTQQIHFAFDSDLSIEAQTLETYALFRASHIGGVTMDLPALCGVAVSHFNIENESLLQALCIAALLGEVENTNAYHNNMHFREVVFQVIRMIAVHNQIFAQTPKAFDGDEIALLLIAACIHDLGHTGQGNKVDGMHIAAYTENRSYDLAEPYLTEAGLGKLQLVALRTMLIGTDVSPFGDTNSPANQMKRAYEYHYLSNDNQYKPVLAYGLEILEADPRLTLMCLVLHEADVATSAGIDYRITCYETSVLWSEIGLPDPRPSHVLDFLEHICKKRFLSDAAQKLYAGNMARIFALAEQDLVRGNHPFASAKHSDFMLGTDSKSQDNQTVN